MNQTKNEQIIRAGYAMAEGAHPDVERFTSLFAEDGVFTDESSGQSFRGRKEIGIPVQIFAKAFPDMHRELYGVYVSGDVVVVELSLNGTHTGPLETAKGPIPASGKKIQVPCCDVFRLKDGQIKSFNCYVEATVLLSQTGVM